MNQAVNGPKPDLKPPRLLRGLFLALLVGIILFLGFTWAIINYQVEQLMAKRTSEYAHSIATIAADTSAEALLSEDTIQLERLVRNVAKDPYIRSATIYLDDGQIIAEYPPRGLMPATRAEQSAQGTDTANLAAQKRRQLSKPQSDEIGNSDSEALHRVKTGASKFSSARLNTASQAFILAQQDIPYVEKINYQSVTAGWFKVVLNRRLLEQSFRRDLLFTQRSVVVVALLLLVTYALVIFRYEVRLKQLTQACHRILQLNVTAIPRGRQQWLNALKRISEIQLQSLREHPPLPNNNSPWQTSRVKKRCVYCYCQFSLSGQYESHAAANLARAEALLQASVQAHGVQSQGDLLSGCLIPFIDIDESEEAVTEAVSLLFLVKQLFATLDHPVEIRGFIGCGAVLVLENERTIVSGVSLFNRVLFAINRLSPLVSFGSIASLAIERDTLRQVASLRALEDAQSLEAPNCFILQAPSDTLSQAIDRQAKYILTQI